MFKTLFEVGAWRAACANASSNVKAIVKTFKEVLDHLSEGLRFYMSLQEAVKQHQQQCSDYAYTRALQRDDLQQVGQAASPREGLYCAAELSQPHAVTYILGRGGKGGRVLMH